MLASYAGQMPTDGELTVLAAGAYGNTATISFEDVQGIVTDVGQYSVIAFRGTVPSSLADWLRDFQAWPREHVGLGWCHDGFLTGALGLWPLLQPLIAGKQVIPTGHSLGGALAIITAGLMVLSGQPPVELVTFGAPRAGGRKLSSVLSSVEIRQYRNGNDPIPDVPLLYEHVRLPLIDVGRPEFDAIECHAIAAYEPLIAALNSVSSPGT